MTQIDTTGPVPAATPGFTVWPSTSPRDGYVAASGGTEFFMSSNAAEEANGNGASTHLIVWTLSNTSSLATPTPNLTITQSS